MGRAAFQPLHLILFFTKEDFTPPLTPPQGGELEKSNDFECTALKIIAFCIPLPHGGRWLKIVINSIIDKKQQ
jgi:hypothetical protein